MFTLELTHRQLRHLRVLLARVGRSVLGAVHEVGVHLVVDLPGADVGLRPPHLRVVHVGARQQQHQARRLAIGHRQRVDLLLRDHLRDFSLGHLDDRRFTGDGHRFLKRLDLHLEVLLQIEADGDREPIDRDGGKPLQLRLHFVGAGLQPREAGTCPSPSLTVVRVTPVSVLRNVSDTPGSTPPCASVTVP
jgi:hypothetical protein